MSFNEEEDESDEFPSSEEEDSDENEYKEKLRKEAGKLKQKRMAPRPSTIVQVSTGPLELHLQSMKKQLKAHAALIEHPPFLDELMLEVNKISGLARKIEHCQLDINTVRETIVATEGSSTSTSLQTSVKLSTGLDVSMTEKLNQLFKDLEMVRAVIRRIDVHQALDATVLVKVTALTKNLKALKEYSEKMHTNNMRVIQDELKGEIKSVNTRIHQMDELNVEKLNEVLARIQKAEDNIHDGQKEETELLAKKVEFLEENLTTDFYTFKEQVDSQLELTKVTAMKAFMKASKGSLGSGMQLIEEYAHKRIITSMRKRFIMWRNYDPVGILHRGRRLMSLTRRSHQKMLTRSALFEWKCYHEKQKERELMSSHLCNIINKWKETAFPSLSKRFYTWKRHCVLMRFHMAGGQAVTNSNKPVMISNEPNDEEENFNSKEYDQLIMSLNPASDIQGSFQLTGLYVDRIYNKITKVHADMKNNDDTTRRIGQRMDIIKNSMKDALEKRCDEGEKQHKTHAKFVSKKIKEIHETHDNAERQNAKRFMATSEEVCRLESSVTNLSIQVDQQTSRLERLFALHQKMLERIDSIEITQKSHDAQLTKVNTQISALSEKSLRNESEIMLHKQSTVTSMASIKEEIQDVQHASKDCSEKMQAVLSNQSQGHSAVSNLTKDFKHKISNIESWLNTTAPKPPSPKLLVTLALKFEDRAVEKHCKDPAHIFSVSMSTELAKDIATCAHWLVYHIVEATDVDVLTRVMKGPQEVATVFDQADPINSLDANTNHVYESPAGGTNKHTKPSHLTHEEFCTTTRESMLLRYLEKFQKELRQSRDEVGVIRKEARSLFLKRFIDSLDLSLQKHDVIVLNTASAMGRNPGHVTGRPTNDGNAPPACVACDRPLRMRTTSRSIGELYEKLLLSGKKTSEIKREVLRNQIVSPQNRPTSPQHSYRFEGEFKRTVIENNIKPSYSEDNFESKLMSSNNNNNNNSHNYNTSSGDFHRANGTDSQGTSRPGGQSVVRIRPTSSSSRLQSAPRDHIVNSQSAAQLTTTGNTNKRAPHGHSPSKGGGFKTAKSSAQDKLAMDIANGLPVETSIPLRHSIDHMPSTTRKLVGKFEDNDTNGDGNNGASPERDYDYDVEDKNLVPISVDEITGVRSVDLIQVYASGKNGLNGSFIPSSVSALPRNTDDDLISDGSV